MNMLIYLLRRFKLNIFNPKFIFINWDNSLANKDVFVDSGIASLENQVNHSNPLKVEKGVPNAPFTVVNTKSNFVFCYYDPNYWLKKALQQGKPVMYRSGFTQQEWQRMPNEEQSLEWFEDPSAEFKLAEIDSNLSQEEQEFIISKVSEDKLAFLPLISLGWNLCKEFIRNLS